MSTFNLGKIQSIVKIVKLLFCMEELERIELWATTMESHKYCNAFSLVVIGRGTDNGDLCDCNGESFSTIQSLIDQIMKITTLFKKPKFLLFQRYVAGNNELRKLNLSWKSLFRFHF